MKSKHMIVCGVLGVFATLLLAPMYWKLAQPPKAENPIYITAAHLDPELMPGYTCIYVDAERDAAYYLKDGYEYHYPEVGAEVYFGNSKGVVDSIKEGVGFYVTVDKDVEVYKGLSGARVKDKDGKDIGFISAAKDKTKILCVSLY